MAIDVGKLDLSCVTDQVKTDIQKIGERFDDISINWSSDKTDKRACLQESE